LSVVVRASGGNLSEILGSRSETETTSFCLRRSSFLLFPLVDSPGGLGRARSPAAKHFDAIYTNNLSL